MTDSAGSFPRKIHSVKSVRPNISQTEDQVFTKTLTETRWIIHIQATDSQWKSIILTVTSCFTSMMRLEIWFLQKTTHLTSAFPMTQRDFCYRRPTEGTTRKFLIPTTHAETLPKLAQRTERLPIHGGKIPSFFLHPRESLREQKFFLPRYASSMTKWGVKSSGYMILGRA